MTQKWRSLPKAKEPLLCVRISQLHQALQGKPPCHYEYKWLPHRTPVCANSGLGVQYTAQQRVRTCLAWTQSWVLTSSQHHPVSCHYPPKVNISYWHFPLPSKYAKDFPSKKITTAAHNSATLAHNWGSLWPSCDSLPVTHMAAPILELLIRGQITLYVRHYRLFYRVLSTS